MYTYLQCTTIGPFIPSRRLLTTCTNLMKSTLLPGIPVLNHSQIHNVISIGICRQIRYCDNIDHSQHCTREGFTNEANNFLAAAVKE